MQFCITRQTDLVSDQDVELIARAIRMQVHMDLCPTWNMNPKAFDVLPAPKVLPADAVMVNLIDAENPTELGFHSFGPDITIYTRGIPGEIHSGPNSISSVISHEILETAIDPRAQDWDRAGYCYEICDPVQPYWYDMLGCSVADFVFPVWFDPNATNGAAMDVMGKITSHHQVAPGGYSLRLGPSGTNPTEIFGAAIPPAWRLEMRTRFKYRKGNRP